MADISAAVQNVILLGLSIGKNKGMGHIPDSTTIVNGGRGNL